MGVAVGIFLIALGGALLARAAKQLWSAESEAGRRPVIQGTAATAEITRDSGADNCEKKLLLATVERVTKERDEARQALLELEDRFGW